MTLANIHPTISDDLPALRDVLDQTGLFPGDLLDDMVGPHLSGTTTDVWLTCYLDGAAVGFCYTVPEELTDGTWNMLALAVRPDVQGRQLGTALVRAAEEHLRRAHQRLLIVETSGTEAFARTRAFYRQTGYQEEARIRDFWAKGDDKVIFRKAL